MTRLVKIITAVFLFLGIFVYLSKPALAEDDMQLERARLPGTLTFSIQRIKEKIRLAITPKSKKFDYLFRLTDLRLNELSVVVDSQENDLVEKTSSRYSSFVGNLIDTVLSDDQKNKAMDLFSKHSERLAELRDKYPANSAYWLYLQQNIDTIQILSEKIK